MNQKKKSELTNSEIAVIEVTEELLREKLYEIRGVKVMLDVDLAEIYGYTTKALNQQVKNNKDRFESDFTFKLTRDEWQDLRSKNMTSSWGGSRYAPNVFTEQGVYMLMTILKGELAAKRFMQSFVDRIELYPERRKDGNWIKNILFNFSIPVVREDEELERIGGISLENSTLSNVDLPLEKLSTHEKVVFLCKNDQN